MLLNRIEMVHIPEGIMPRTSDSVSCYRPEYAETVVPGFYIGKYAITALQWISVMDYLVPGFEDLAPNHPVFNVSYFDVQRFIKQLNQLSGVNARLPTELEWEFAARAGCDKNLPVSLAELMSGKYINYDKKVDDVLPVGSLPPNAWGCYEMLGNIWEWVSDQGHSSFLEQTHILKGGCWASSYHDIGFSNRAEHDANEYGWDTFGFRILVPIEGNHKHALPPELHIKVPE